MDAYRDKLSGPDIRRALEALGAELRAPVEMVLVGGAAGLLLNLLPATVVTADVDAIGFKPSEEVNEVLMAAETIALRDGIARGWLSVDAGLFTYSIPEGWEERRVQIGQWGNLAVWAVARIDFIAMKFHAHRPADLEHLAMMRLSDAELKFVRKHLESLAGKIPDERSRVEMALEIIGEWGLK